jgi:hypothetical protein
MLIMAQGRRAPLCVALAPGFHISRLRRLVPTFEAKPILLIRKFDTNLNAPVDDCPNKLVVFSSSSINPSEFPEFQLFCSAFLVASDL